MLYFQFLVVAAVFAAIAWLATGRGGQVGETYPDRPDVALPDDRQLAKSDIDAARFTVGWRGYRMDEVDAVLDRLAAEIDYRDRLIAQLTQQEPASVGSSLEYRPATRAQDAIPGTASGTMALSGMTALSSLPPSAVAPREAGPEASGGADAGEPSGSADENPLSQWYRKPDSE